MFYNTEVLLYLQVLQRNGVLINEKGNSDFDPKDIIQDMSRLLKQVKGETNNFASNPENEKQTALCAMAAVIKYLEVNRHYYCFTIHLLLIQYSI